MQKIQIAPAVALKEATALAEHYRNRALMHAQAVYEMQQERRLMEEKKETDHGN